MDNDNNIVFNRMNLQNNITANITNTTKLQVNINSNFQTRTGPSIHSNDLYNKVVMANPVMFPVKYADDGEDSHIKFGSKAGRSGLMPNPYAALVRGSSKSKSSTIMAMAKLSQDITCIEGLSADAMVSTKVWGKGDSWNWYDPFYYEIDESTITQSAPGVYDYDLKMFGEGGNTALNFDSSNAADALFTFQGNIAYNRTFGKHDIQSLLVYNQSEFVRYYHDSHNPKDVLPFRNQGLSGRLSYMYNNKYMIETNIGYTGSENFAEGYRFGVFPSISVGYAISNEKFFKNIFGESISLLKFRASAGRTGNDNIGFDRFPYMADVNLNDGSLGYVFGEDYNNHRNGVRINRYPNELVTWETSEKMNAGFDLETAMGLTINADYFLEYRSGIFMASGTIPATAGVNGTTPFINFGEVKNEGFDLTVNYNKAINSDLIIQARGTFTYAHNEVLVHDEPEGYGENFPNLTKVGYPVNQLWGLRADKIFETQEEVDNHNQQSFGSNYGVGDIKYINVNDDPQIDGTDLVPMGMPWVPEVTYGFGFSVIYKKFDVSAFFQGVARTSFFVGNVQPFTIDERNLYKFIADDYYGEHNPDPYATFPRVTEDAVDNNIQNSSWWLRDGSFLRLKDVEIGYNMNKNIRLYATGQNLATFSKFKLWDPETKSGNGLAYPLQRSITLGAQFNF